jgi:hypothetical protein
MYLQVSNNRFMKFTAALRKLFFAIYSKFLGGMTLDSGMKRQRKMKQRKRTMASTHVNEPRSPNYKLLLVSFPVTETAVTCGSLISRSDMEAKQGQ